MSINATVMVGQDPNQRKSFTASVDLEAHRLVAIDSTDSTQVGYPSAQFGECFGVTLHAAEAGEPVEVAVGGFAMLKVDGNASNIAIGDSLCAHDATGLGQKVAGGAAGNRKCIGFANAASTADGDLISIEVAKHLAYFAA